MSLAVFSDSIRGTLAGSHAIGTGWLHGGLAYAGYNLAVVPALLFCARHQTRRREALIAGALTGPIAIIPGMLFFLALLALYPQIRTSALPVQALLTALNRPYLSLATQVILFGTLAKTGVGIVHGFNERLVGAMPGISPGRSRAIRSIVPLGLSAVAIVLATRVGLVALIAQGYGHIAWVVIAIYAVPLLTVGMWQIYRRRATDS